jgi:mono/diheme cytochrome c family protein
MKATTIAVVLSALVLVSLGAAATPPGKKANTVAAIVTNTDNADTMRVQGEVRFRTNCGRCHAAPHKFPPRMMATIIRHMRVRATITDEDMRLVLFYMTQ